MIISLDDKLEKQLMTNGLTDDDALKISYLLYHYNKCDFFFRPSRDFLKWLIADKNNDAKFGTPYKNILNNMHTNYSTDLSFLSPTVVIAGSGLGYNQKEKVYYISFADVDGITKPILLSENISDCEFYEKITKKYQHDVKSASCNLVFDRLTTGGGDTRQLGECCSKHKIVLGIFDSDRHFPNDTIGGTAADMITCLSKQPWKINIKVLNVRCKENLLPAALYASQLQKRVPDTIKCLNSTTISDATASFFPLCSLNFSEYKRFSGDPNWEAVCSDAINYAKANNIFQQQTGNDGTPAILGLSKKTAGIIDLTNLNWSELKPTQQTDWEEIADELLRIGDAPLPTTRRFAS